MELARHAAVIIDIVDEYKPQLVRMKQFKGVLTNFVELLEDIGEYAVKYKDRHGIWRTLTETSDREEYEELIGRLRTLKEEDPAAEAKLLVHRLGGLEAVEKDAVKMKQVCSKLGIADQLQISMVGTTKILL
ncbi:hypothetical protein GPECTOR_98g787 [Gonium pectorale]|uniref:Uncharacterized protein n=1 Tax=Gonium pectorale TaxID=33097 RepID=A0A150FZZ9_GONPE|nr:hypothetical protein GPECTOR_98g787 [Gonium pectorale]|eukprot:KXZ43203.1 hypothetical protein GPECTOR_98g787 [Gonium pectorale]